MQLGGDDDTLNERCPLCGARASVDAALVRAGAKSVTIVSRYERPRFGSAAVETSKAIVSFADGALAKGDGHSREEAILRALESVGVSL